MPLDEPPPDVPVVDDRARCQARPLSARRGYRDDLLCASIARSSVDFLGGAVPVCGIHLKSYVRWGVGAEAEATRLWAWPLAELEPGRLS
jgi:hypothetical protein